MDESRVKHTKHPNILKTRSESGTEDVYYPLMHEGLSEEHKLYAEQVLNETEEKKAEGIRRLKEYIKRERITCPDENFMVMALRNCKYDIPQSESKLKRFLRTRQLIIKKVTQMDSEKMKTIFDEMVCLLLPWRNKEGGIITYTRPNVSRNCDSDDYAFCGVVQVLFGLQFPLSSIYGAAHIGDNKSSEYNYYFILNALRKTLFLLFDMPYRFGREDIINEHFFSRLCLKILKPFAPQKLKERIMCHGTDLESLHKIYHPDILPEELGGNLGPLCNKHYREELLLFIERLREEHLEMLSTEL